MALYDTIGIGYRRARIADPRITEKLVDLLSLPPGSAIADIGAGTGNYSIELARAGYPVIAIEPSLVMARQADSHDGVRWVQASAESLPLAGRAVAACISILSYHHFRVRKKALHEMMRVAGDGPLAFFTFCPKRLSAFWLCRYFPAMLADAKGDFTDVETTAAEMERLTGRKASLHGFPLPADLRDCFAAAGWRRPELYLDPGIRRGISSFARVSVPELETGLARLSSELENGTWDRENGHLKSLPEYDLGYFFILLTE